MDQIRPYGPGKFSTIPDAYVYELAQEGMNDEFTDQDGQWHGMLRNEDDTPLFDPNVEVTMELNDAEKEFLLNKAGAILTEDGDGRISVSYFDTAEDLDATWARLYERAEVGTDEQMDGLPEIPESDSKTKLNDELLASAREGGKSDAKDGAEEGDAPSLLRIDDWAQQGVTSDDRDAFGILVDAWRDGVREFHASESK